MAIDWINGHVPAIPKISDELLSVLCERIKPVILQEDDKLMYIKDEHPRNTAFTWSPKPTVEAVGIVEFARIPTNHLCGYIGFFKPSIDEVLAQIPDDMLEKVVAFRTISDDVQCYSEGDGHKTVTILYQKA